MPLSLHGSSPHIWHIQQIIDLLTGRMTDQDVTLGRNLTVRGSLTVDGSSPGGGVTDHGQLTGLADNDHPQYAGASHAHPGVYEPASTNLQAHVGITAGNPHGTTAANVGAALAGHGHDSAYEAKNTNIQGHVAATGNPHGATAADVGAAASTHNHDAAYEAKAANIQTHIASTSNPHATTGDQVLPAQAGQAGKFLATDGAISSWGTPASGGGGAKAVYINLVNHFTTLENITSTAATWKIPAVATYGQIAAYLDMAKLGTPASAELICVYTNTATTGTNRIGLVLSNAPVAAGTTVTPVASSVATLANSSVYPQTIVKAVTPSELGTTAKWAQWCLNIATATVGPNVFSLALVLYY